MIFPNETVISMMQTPTLSMGNFAKQEPYSDAFSMMSGVTLTPQSQKLF